MIYQKLFWPHVVRGFHDLLMLMSSCHWYMCKRCHRKESDGHEWPEVCWSELPGISLRSQGCTSCQYQRVLCLVLSGALSKTLETQVILRLIFRIFFFFLILSSIAIMSIWRATFSIFLVKCKINKLPIFFFAQSCSVVALLCLFL